MSAVPHLTQELEKASSMVMTARRLLSTGTTVDLSALEGKIRGVCETVAELPKDLGETMIPALEKLIGDLDRLAEMVCDRMDPPPSPPEPESGGES
ncbi:hypothetical protein [Magnetospirillum sulfuroxidans]|uniref:Uncharacterized protein n=1 Tax=Magnetospirillum sulfuroxidans TaxID=611300 RepID=A0ABS5IFJ4_9PROT|nr:hypothetical protein [Magnetospirillum sulfuroxidans]MBR9973170.1 hypothetical protein [Magnetospirillum sulfuroxidans]